MAIFLGIDGGGSKTSCLVGDETSILGAGTAAGSNLVRVGEAQSREALAAAIIQAFANASINPSQVQKTCVGLAGAARPEISESVRRFVAELVPGEIEVVGDMVIALEAAFGSEPGVIVIAGTGSIAYGRNSQGQTARAGGWGFAISDEGSGHWIGRAAVAAAMRAQDEHCGTNNNERDHITQAGATGRHADPSLLVSLMNSWRVETREQLVLAANATPPPDFSALFPEVLASADRGDPIALDVLTQAGAELAGLAGSVAARLFKHADPLSIAIAMSGGIFASSPLVRQVFDTRVRSQCPNVMVNPNVIEPVRGALERARKRAEK